MRKLEINIGTLCVEARRNWTQRGVRSHKKRQQEKQGSALGRRRGHY